MVAKRETDEERDGKQIVNLLVDFCNKYTPYDKPAGEKVRRKRAAIIAQLAHAVGLRASDAMSMMLFSLMLAAVDDACPCSKGGAAHT